MLGNMNFLEAMEHELKTNKHKKNWKSWNPSALEAIAEINHHVAKLADALVNNDSLKIKEHSADVANICERIFTTKVDLSKFCRGCNHLDGGCVKFGIPANDFSLSCEHKDMKQLSVYEMMDVEENSKGSRPFARY